MADSVRLLPGAPPPHGTAPVRPPDRGQLADAPDPQRPEGRVGGTRRPPGDDKPLAQPLPEEGVPVHQVHGGVVQQVQGGAGDAPQPRRPEAPVAPGRDVAAGRAGTEVLNFFFSQVCL